MGLEEGARVHEPSYPPSPQAVGAALFLLAREYFPQWEGWPVGELAIFKQAGVTSDEAYEAREAVLERLFDLLWDPDYDPSDYRSTLKELTMAISAYMADNPDCMLPTGKPKYLRFLLYLMKVGGAGLTLRHLSELTGVPLQELELAAVPGQKKCPSYTG